jgi:hypothetical protein
MSRGGGPGAEGIVGRDLRQSAGEDPSTGAAAVAFDGGSGRAGAK